MGISQLGTLIGIGLKRTIVSLLSRLYRLIKRMGSNLLEALKRPFHNFTDEDAVVEGKKVYIMRPCMIHGPGNKGNLNLLYGVVSKGIPWPLGAFENRRSFTSIGNLQEVPGEYRRSQNWIGGSTIQDAIFVPPVHTLIPELIGDIENFVHNETLAIPDLIKIALVHYQFETIHPFLDGNGRTGRLLVTLYLVSKGLIKRPILYLSDYLERHRNTYYSTMMTARIENDIRPWIKFFLNGIIKTAENGVNTFSDILAVEKTNEEMAQRLGTRSANAIKVLNSLYNIPIVDATTVRSITGLSIASAYKLIFVMEEAGLLTETTGGKRGKIYILKNYFDIFNREVKYE